MKKRTLAALAASMLIAVTTVDTFVAPQMAHAQASDATASATVAPATAAPQAASTAADEAVPPPAPATSETVSNPYGLSALWKNGDFVARFVLILLVIMSMGSWYIMFVKVYEQTKLFKQAREVQKTFWQAGSVTEGMNTLKDGSPFRYIAESGIKASSHHEGKLLEQIDLNTWVTMSIERAVGNVSSRLQDGLAFLATVGSTSPFVGLFGTVWGIYHALTAIGIAGQASIDKVAGPVGEALIMTAIGLAVAVPAVLGYNWLVRRNKVALEQLRAFAADLHMVLMSGNQKQVVAQRPVSAAR
jgi:biopolymer transport protein ExbB